MSMLLVLLEVCALLNAFQFAGVCHFIFSFLKIQTSCDCCELEHVAFLHEYCVDVDVDFSLSFLHKILEKGYIICRLFCFDT